MQEPGGHAKAAEIPVMHGIVCSLKASSLYRVCADAGSVSAETRIRLNSPIDC